jgi:hypothetical protein
VDLINPYAVLRNTATYDAFKAYSRKAAMSGHPFFMAGVFLGVLAPQILLFGSRWLPHKSPLDWRWAFACLALSVALSGICLGIGAMRTIRFRREHPIPEEWRQVPHISPLLDAARKLRLP